MKLRRILHWQERGKQISCFLKIVEQDKGKWKKGRGEGREGERKTCLENVVKTRVRIGGEEREKKRTEWQLGRQ